MEYRANQPGLWAGNKIEPDKTMKKTCLIGSLATMALLVAGCETDGLSTREDHNSYAAMVNSLYRQPRSAATNQPLVAPFQLAVAQIGEVTPDSSFVAELGKDPALIRHVIPLPFPGKSDGNRRYYGNQNQTNSPELLASEVESLRNLSRDAGARCLLVVGGSIDSCASHNPLTLFDVTIVGAAVLPSVEVKSDGKAAGALIDVETGRIVLLTDAQARETGMSPTFYADDRRDAVNSELRAQLLKKLADNFLDSIRQQVAANAAAH